MDLKKQRQLVDAVLSDWPVARRKHVVLHFEGRAVTASVVSESGELVVGEAKCHPVDKFDDFSGAVFALARLRVRYAYRQMMRKFKTWIPEYGQLYFVPSVHGKSSAVASMASARSIVWKSSPIDLMYLAMGLVFRSPKDAMKKARTLLFDGHNIRNIVNRLTPPDDVLRQSAELPADLPAYAQDIKNQIDTKSSSESASDIRKRKKKQKKKEKRMMEEAELAEQTKFDVNGFFPDELAVFDDDVVPPLHEDDDDDIPDEVPNAANNVLLFSEMFDDDDSSSDNDDLQVVSWEPVMQPGKRYYMDPVTGNVVLAEP